MVKALSKNAPPGLGQWGLLLIGALLGGSGLIGSLMEYQSAQKRVAGLREEVAQFRGKIDRESALQAEVARLEGEIEGLLRTPITEEEAPAVIASTVAELGWRNLQLSPTPGTEDSSTQGEVRRTSFSAQWQSSWEDLLRGVAALKERGIFVRNLSVRLDEEGTLRCEAALVHLSRSQR